MKHRKSILFGFSNTNFVTVLGIDGTGSQRPGWSTKRRTSPNHRQRRFAPAGLRLRPGRNQKSKAAEPRAGNWPAGGLRGLYSCVVITVTRGLNVTRNAVTSAAPLSTKTIIMHGAGRQSPPIPRDK